MYSETLLMTNNEFGFDYLRDNMALQSEEKVQRGHSFAIVDEVDSVLIDEARTPLIISGAVDTPVDETFTKLNLCTKFSEKTDFISLDFVKEARNYINQEDEENAGLKLLQAQRNAKHRQVMKIFQEPGMLNYSRN